MMKVIDVIIPVYRRQEFIECIKSLQQAAYLIKNIIICSDDIRSLKSQLDKFNSRIPIKYIKESFSQFNKSVLVNSGIMQSKADYILCSDADIIWNLETIESLLKNVMNKKKLHIFTKFLRRNLKQRLLPISVIHIILSRQKIISP